jgi:hypothetical protein
LFGILPLFFFFAQAIHYWRIDQLGHMLWMCNIGNFLLAAGLFLDEPVLIRVAVIWSIPGLLIWFRYVVTDWFSYSVLDWGAIVASTLAHIGGLGVGLFALAKVGMNRSTWLYSLAWFIILQVVSHVATPPDLNVNLSQHVYESCQGYFKEYWRFWIVMTLVVAVGSWLLGRGLSMVWPSRLRFQRE